MEKSLETWPECGLKTQKTAGKEKELTIYYFSKKSWCLKAQNGNATTFKKFHPKPYSLQEGGDLLGSEEFVILLLSQEWTSGWGIIQEAGGM